MLWGGVTGYDMDDDFEALIADIERKKHEEERKIYSERTLKEAYNPRNVGKLAEPSGSARVTGPCGDTMQIDIRVEAGRICDCKFITDGCGASIACGSVVTGLAKGKRIEEALEITAKDVLKLLGGLPSENVHCATLAVNTLRAAVSDYQCRSQKGSE